MVLGRFPYADPGMDDPFFKTLALGKYDIYWKYFGKGVSKPLSDEFKDLMQSLLNLDPAKRPKMKDLLKHPFMQKEYDV